MAHGPALSTAKRGYIYVGSEIRDSLSLLEVLYANQFEGEPFDANLLEQTEKTFYRGAPPTWLNFHISDQAGCGIPLIKRDAYNPLIQQIRQRRKHPGISTIKLFHQPGCGGTTVTMQVLWDLRKTFRCAVLTDSTSDRTNIAKEVVQVFTAGSRSHQNTVLLLLSNEQILDNLEDSIMEEIAQKKIVTDMCVVILLSCVRKDVVLQRDYIVLKNALSYREKHKFAEKKKELGERYPDEYGQFHGFNIMETNFWDGYVKHACTIFNDVQTTNRPPKTQLVAFLCLLNDYVPGSYLLESQCLDFLGSSRFPHLSLEDRMQPFSHLIVTFQQDLGSEKRVRVAHPLIAKLCTELMAEAGVPRSDTARNFLTYFCIDVSPCLLGFVKDMLTKREPKKDKNNEQENTTEENPFKSTEVKDEKYLFSRLILDIQEEEGKGQSASVLKVASKTFANNPYFPQALARFYSIELQYYNLAEMWAKRAKKRDPKSSFIANTLGQVHKHHLNNKKKRQTSGHPATPRDILILAKKATEAFKEEEQLAENECGADMREDDNAKVSHIYNYRGLFGFLQVCGILYDLLVSQNETWKDVLTCEVAMGSVLESLGDNKLFRFNNLIKSLKDDVKRKCHFLNAYLTYSRPSMQKEDPSYIKRDISSCYFKYIQHSLPNFSHPHESYIAPILKKWPVGTKNNSSNLLELIEKANNSYENAYAKYFRSRYLVPLFYLGKDHIVPAGIEQLLLDSEDATEDFIHYMKAKDKLFKDLRVQKYFLKCQGRVKNCKILATVGGVEIMMKANMRDCVWKAQEVSFYLGFTIRGPVAFGIQVIEKECPRSCASCGNVEDSTQWTEISLDRTTSNGVTTYSVESNAGQFQCSESGLRWVCKNKTRFTYRYRSWQSYEQELNSVSYSPGGPLLHITVEEGKLDEVYLPHGICMDSLPTVSDKFAVLHREECGVFLEQVSTVSPSHIKLYYPSFSTNGVLVGGGFPVKVHCRVLLCQTSEKFLTLRVYLIPRDPVLQQELEQMEKARGSRIIENPNPVKSLQMLDSVSLTSDAKAANISPPNIQLRPGRGTTNCFTVFISEPTSAKFMLMLQHGEERVWSCSKK